MLFKEPFGDRCLQAMVTSPVNRLSAANLLEAAIIVDRLPEQKYAAVFDGMIRDLGFIIEPVTLEQVSIARDAYQRFGKGSGHRAQLNFGDCFAYALARFYDEPLLFVGNDFSQTDLRPALP